MNAGNMPNNQFNEFMPQGPGAQQKNIEVYAQSLAHQHRVAMSNTSSPQGINSGVQGSPMAQSGLDGQDLTFAGNGPRPGSMPTNPPGAPQQGNHALQDYQMQLMLLEQQNKKRLLMARQEQDNQSGHPQQGVIGAPGFGAAMSPQGSRAGGPSPNPADQMKRGTPKLGQQNLPGSPMPEGIMGQQRGSPAPNMNFDPTLAPPGMPPQFYPQNMGPGPNGNPMMRPPSSHPNGGPQFNGQPMTQEQMQAMRNGQMAQNGGWRGGPQPGMMGPGVAGSQHFRPAPMFIDGNHGHPAQPEQQDVSQISGGIPPGVMLVESAEHTIFYRITGNICPWLSPGTPLTLEPLAAASTTGLNRLIQICNDGTPADELENCAVTECIELANGLWEKGQTFKYNDAVSRVLTLKDAGWDNTRNRGNGSSLHLWGHRI